MRRNGSASETTKPMDSDDRLALGTVLQRLEKRHKLKSPSKVKRNLRISEPAHWIRGMEESQSVMIGRVIYPTKVVEKIAIAGRDKTRPVSSAAFLESLSGSRAFLTSNNCSQSSFLSTENSQATQQEYLLIKMKPKFHESSPAGTPADGHTSQGSAQERLPDLELRLDINREERILTPVQTRIAFMSRESDLLLPHRSSDVKFITEQYINAPPDLDPAISAFIEASNFDLSGSRRWGTPSSFKLSVPMYTSKGMEDLGNDFNKTGQQPPVEYNYTALEHRTQLVEERDGFQYEYTVIEAGRFGGRREEFRIRILSQSKTSSTSRRPLAALFDKASRLIDNLDKKKRAGREEITELIGPGVKPLELGLPAGYQRRREKARGKRSRGSVIRKKPFTARSRGLVMKKIPFSAKNEHPLEQNSDGSPGHVSTVPPVDVLHNKEV